MKKLLIIVLLIVGCAVNVGHNPILKLNIATKQSEKSCLKECEKYAKSSEAMEDITDEEHTNEWCNCMDICFDMDGGASYCPTDSTKNNQSKKESNQQNVTILTRYMTVTGTIIKYDDEKVIIHGAVSGMLGNIEISNSNIELSIKDILLIDYGIKTIYKNETDSTKRVDLLNKLNKIFPEGN